MKHKPGSLEEAAYQVLRGEYLTEKKLISVGSAQDLLKKIKKDPKLKKHIGKQGVYFDDVDLVVGDKTVASNPIWDDGTVDWDEVTKGILTKSKSAEQIKKEKQPKADEAKIGNFIVKLPKEMKGVLGSPNTPITNPRAIVTADDEEAAQIKKLLHDTKAGIKVRIMKRKDGNKVYVDGKDQENFNAALKKLEKIK